MANDTNTKKDYKLHDKRQLLVLVRYKPQGMMDAASLLDGPASAVEGVVGQVESAASSIPGLSLFFKEEQEPEKKCDKEYNYFQDYKEWDVYMKKMKSGLSNKINIENDTLVFDFDATNVAGREKAGKTLFNQVKQKTASWAGYSACFHFIGLGQGGNIANECIKELCKETNFKNKWWVQSVVYVGTPLYKNQHRFNETDAFKGMGKKYAFGNAYDLTAQVIDYFEPNDKLRKIIAEINSNPVSVFTGKLKTNLVSALGNLMGIDGFGSGHDNSGNLDKLKNSKDDISGLVGECVNAVKSLVNAFPDLIKPGDLPKFDQLLNGFDAVPGQCVRRLEKFLDEVTKAAKGTSLNTDRINKSAVLNFLCPLVDKLTAMLKLFTVDAETTGTAFDKIIERAGIKKILAPAEASFTQLPMDDYINKVAAMAAEAEKKKATATNKDGDSSETVDEIIYDQSVTMINTSKSNLVAVTKDGDLNLEDKAIPDETKTKVADCITALLLPMMPSKKKFYSQVLAYIPLDGVNGFLSKLTGDTAFAPLQKLTANFLGDFDEGTPEEPGLKTSIKNFDAELSRIKGFLKKNNYPVHKDANSLYFIYNSHNQLLKKTYGPVLNVVDRETGYLDYMENTGAANHYNLNQNDYSPGANPSDNIAPAMAVTK